MALETPQVLTLCNEATYYALRDEEYLLQIIVLVSLNTSLIKVVNNRTWVRLAILTAMLFVILFCRQIPQVRHKEQSVGVLDGVVIGFQE
jgi:4-hydroxybenzoate polyprenyltransferase